MTGKINLHSLVIHTTQNFLNTMSIFIIKNSILNIRAKI